jgi:hypothetical protein
MDRTHSVARWFVFKPKIPILVKFRGPWNDHLEFLRSFGIIYLWPLGIVCGHLVYFYVLVCMDQEKSGNPDRTDCERYDQDCYVWKNSQQTLKEPLNLHRHPI